MDMTANHDDAVIVRSTVELARNLGLHVVAEGVEDQGAWDELTRFGCHTAQGYLLSPPLPPAELGQWLDGRLIAPPAR
jgi:EAL domain-containing protein (putative c-di-GMP-specific phosphodiesterase class I)